MRTGVGYGIKLLVLRVSPIPDLIEKFDKLGVGIKIDCAWVVMGYLNDDDRAAFDKRMPVNRPRPGSDERMSEAQIQEMLNILKGNTNIKGF